MTTKFKLSFLLLLGLFSHSSLLAQEFYYSGKADSARMLCELVTISAYSAKASSVNIEYGVLRNGETLQHGKIEVALQPGLNNLCLNEGFTDSAFLDFLRNDSVLPSGQYKIWAKVLPDRKLFLKTFRVPKTNFPFKKMQLTAEQTPKTNFRVLGTDSADLFVFKFANGRIDSLNGKQVLSISQTGRRPIHISYYRHGCLLSDTIISKTKFFTLLSKSQISPKAMFDMGKDQLAERLPDKTRLLSLGAEIIYETQVSNLDTLYPELPQNYHRVFVTPRVDAFGVPFVSEFYYTTESGYGYNLNSFNLSFDRSQWEENIRTDFDAKFNELNSTASTYDQRLTEIDSELEELANERNRLSNSLENSEYQPLDKNEFRQKAQRRISDSPNGVTNGLKDSLYQRTDSLDSRFDSSASLKGRDKLVSYRNQVVQQHDQLMMEKERVSSKLTACNEKKLELERSWNSRDSMIRNQKDKYLSKIKGLELGLHAPTYSRAVLWGTPVSGVSVSGEHENVYFQSTHGKYTDTNYWVLANQPASFPNTFSAFKAGIKNADGYFVETGVYRFAVREKPLAYTTGISTGIRQGSLELNAETHAFLPDKEKMTIAESNTQMHVHVGYTLPVGAIKLSGAYERIGAHYLAPAQPFFRNNLQWVETRVSKEFYKGSVQSSVFIRNERPIDAYGLAYNYTGMGAELNAVLPNGLMLGGSYTPFQQSISALHQTLQQQTQFSVLNGYAQHAFMVWQSRHRLGLQAMAMQYVFQDEAPKWFRQYSINHEVKFPYPFELRGTINFLNNQVQEGEDAVFALTGSTELTYEQKKWAAIFGYHKNLNYLDNSGYEALTVGFNYQPFSRVGLQLSYSRRRYENWPFLDNQSENVINLMSSISL